MRVALLTPYFLPTIGGAELYVYDLARFLIKHGHQASILTTNIYQRKQANLPSVERITHIPVRRFKVLGFSRKLTRFFISMYIPKDNVALEVKRKGFNLLHFHNVTDMTFPVALWNIKVPKILTCHTLFEVINYHYMIGPRLYFFKKILQNMDFIHVLTLKDFMTLKHLGVDSKKIFVIPPGISVTKFYSSERKGNTLLFVGRIAPTKSIETLLEALLRIKSDCQLWVAGPIQDKKYFVWLKNRYFNKLKNKVRILGPLSSSELLEVYAKADIFVFPSKAETFGLVLLEAMASSLPVVSTDVGAARELIKDWENGFIVPINDWKTMAERINLLLTDDNLRRKMGKNNRKLIEKDYDINVNFEKLLALYEQICIK